MDEAAARAPCFPSGLRHRPPVGWANIVDLDFTFEDNGTAHDDLVLRLGNSVWRCDSYYLALDEGVFPEREDAQKVRAVLRVLLETWRTAIGALANGASVYLPYDFSDQCTAWLACELQGSELLVQHGWADVEGWTISPSDPTVHVAKLAGFSVDGGPWRVSVSDFLKGIIRSIEAAAP